MAGIAAEERFDFADLGGQMAEGNTGKLVR
jgi:hypothetical protein